MVGLNENENMVKQTTTAGEMDVNYCQVVPMTFQERFAMYMKCDKEELAKMLAERDRLGLDYNPPQYVPYPYPCPDFSRWDITCSDKSQSSVSISDSLQL